jgi:hypothetical protein
VRTDHAVVAADLAGVQRARQRRSSAYNRSRVRAFSSDSGTSPRTGPMWLRMYALYERRVVSAQLLDGHPLAERHREQCVGPGDAVLVPLDTHPVQRLAGECLGRVGLGRVVPTTPQRVDPREQHGSPRAPAPDREPSGPRGCGEAGMARRVTGNQVGNPENLSGCGQLRTRR